MIRIGIVGTGNIVGISHFHTLGLLCDGRAEITAVYDTRMDGAREWAAQHGLNCRVCGSFEEMLDYVDAVNICVPNAFHCDYALRAIKAGKHFLVEKPMAVQIEDCRKLAAACAEYGKTNMVGFVYRFSNAVQQARKIVREQIGDVYTLSAWFGGKRLADPSTELANGSQEIRKRRPGRFWKSPGGSCGLCRRSALQRGELLCRYLYSGTQFRRRYDPCRKR